MVDQDEIERPELSYDRDPQRDLPCPRESQIRPHPGPEDRQERQHQSSLDSVAVSRREQIEEQRSRAGEQRGDQRSREKFDKAETLERGRRQHRQDRAQREDRVILPVERDHFIQPVGGTFGQSQSAVQHRLRNPECVIVIGA